MYPKINGDEYYNTNTYKIDSDGKEVYASLKNGSEKYLQFKGLDIMAKKFNLKREWVPYFAMDQFKHPICPRLETNMMYLELDIPYPKNSKDKQLYPKLNDKEYYIGKNRECQYALDEYQEQYYALNGNDMYYAFHFNDSGEDIEFPRKNKKQEDIFIVNNYYVSYPFNLSKFQPIYPKNELDEYYMKVNDIECFAIRNNKPFYAKNNQGHEILPRDSKNSPYYIFYMENSKKYQVYPTINKEQYYLQNKQYKVYAKKDKDEYYAKKENKDEFFADASNEPYYAKNKNEVEIYPSKNNKNNFYKKIKEKEIVARNKRTWQGFYARDLNKNEFYPKLFYQIIENESIPQVEVKTNYDFIEPTLTDIMTHVASAT